MSSRNRRRQRRFRPFVGHILEVLEPRQLLSSITFTKVADTSGKFTGFIGAYNSLPSINNQGTVAFQGLLATGGAGIFSSSSGSTKPIVNTTGTFECFASTSINASGKVAFWAGLKTGAQGIYVSDSTTPMTTIAENQNWSPYTGFGTEPVIDDAGFVLFNPTWGDAGWTSDYRITSSASIARDSTSSGGVFTADTYNPYSLISSPSFSGQDATRLEDTAVCWAFRKDGGQNILTTTNGVTTSILDTQGVFNYLGIPTINDAGTTVALQATLATGGSEVITINNGGSPTVVADTNGAYSAFNPDVGVDGRGRVVFLASLDDGGKGLFTGPDAAKDKIIQTGDSLAGSTVTNLAFGREGMNDSGQIVFWAKLANGKEGIYQTKATAFVNHPPVAANDSYDAIQNTPLIVSAGKGVLLNDHDPDGDPLTAKIVSQPKAKQGTVTMQDDGSFVYEPGDFHGVATFTYKANDGKAKSAVTTVTITVTTDGQTPIEGWSSDTHYHEAETTVQKAIVAAATAAKGQPSGQSSVDGGWQTDLADGDDGRIMNAITTYAKWKDSLQGRTLTTDQFNTELNTTTTKMKAALHDGKIGYTVAADQKRLVDKIRSVYDNNPDKPLPTLSNPQTILDYLGIRKQCKEWVDSIAITAHGTPKTYDEGLNPNIKVDPSLYRPGMALFTTDGSHAMIIVDIYWDAKGNPTKFRVAEANYPTPEQSKNPDVSGWNNPDGMVPWARTVRVDREFSFKGYGSHSVKVVKLES